MCCAVFFTPGARLYAQAVDCTFKPPVVKMDFGAGNNFPDLNLDALRNYRNDNIFDSRSHKCRVHNEYV